MTILELVKQHYKKLYSSFGSLLSLIIVNCFFWFGYDFEIAKLYEINNIAINLAGVLLGFLITAIAIITAIMDRTLIDNMRKTGHFHNLMSDSFTTCSFLLCVIIVGFINLFIANAAMTYGMGLLLYFLVFSFLNIIKLGKNFSNVISSL